VLHAFFSSTTFAVALGLATPILLAGMGECISELAGVLNIGIEGTMLTAAFAGAACSYVSGSVLVGVVGAVVSAMLVLLAHGLLTITVGADQIVSGVAINVGALGGTTFLARLLLADQPQVPRMDTFEVPGLSQIPFLGKALFSQRPLTYLALVVPFALWFVLYKSQLGVRIRAVGDEPGAVESVGINVHLIRYSVLLAAAGLMGLGGASLSIAEFNGFVENMTGGVGFIALAAVVFGNWRPIPIAGAALLFGYVESLQAELQIVTNAVPNEFFLALPYLVTVVVVVAAVRRDRMPTALARAYRPRGIRLRRRVRPTQGEPA
jgi:general nucleoside transport system permease protein